MAKPALPTAAFAIYGPIARDDLPGLCHRVCALLRASRTGVALCDVSGVEPDAVVVDALLFYFSLVFCRGENQQHYPSACPPVDRHPGALFEWGVVGVALVCPVLGWLGHPRSRWVVAFGGFAVAAWLVYFVSILAT